MPEPSFEKTAAMTDVQHRHTRLTAHRADSRFCVHKKCVNCNSITTIVALLFHLNCARAFARIAAETWPTHSNFGVMLERVASTADIVNPFARTTRSELTTFSSRPGETPANRLERNLMWNHVKETQMFGRDA